jgi:hypothetical protein
MLLEVPLIFSSRNSASFRCLVTSALLSLLFFTGGCAEKTLKPEDVIKRQTKQKVFLAPYDEVWRAAHTVLKYPIINENQDTGIIETDYIKAQDGFSAPEQSAPSSGLRYKIVMIFAKGKSQGLESVRVTIDKNLEKLRDFFSDAEVIPSDGLEEKVLFYRIERELLISKGLRKAAEEQSSTPF